MENGNRTQSVDIAKGILIILVVVAQCTSGHSSRYYLYIPHATFLRDFWLSPKTREIIKDWVCEGKD